MLFALVCTDKPNSLELRMSTRPDHLAFLQSLNEAGTLKIAGPTLDADDKPAGSLIVVEAADRDTARAIADDDPYAKAGLFASVEIKPFNWVINNPDAA